jgi:hypothetical protein
MKTIRTRLSDSGVSDKFILTYSTVLVEFKQVAYEGEPDSCFDTPPPVVIWEAQFLPDVEVMQRPFELRATYACTNLMQLMTVMQYEWYSVSHYLNKEN